MNYDLIIVKIPKPHVKKILAHHIAADPSISLQKALSQLDNLPTEYMRDLSKEELEEALKQMDKLGVACSVVESKNPLEGILQHEELKKKDSTVSDTQMQQETPRTAEKTTKPALHTGVAQQVGFRSSPPHPAVAPQKETEKKKSPIVNVLLVAGLIILIGIILFIGKNRSYKIKSTGPLMTKQGTSQAARKRAGKSPTGSNQDYREYEDYKNSTPEEGSGRTQKESTAMHQKASSDRYADSAVSVGDDYTRAIKFYKIAISFNPYNLRAWQGLVAAYRSVRMWKEAEEAKTRMAELFKEETSTIESIIEPYGVLSGFNRDEHGVCRIEYRTKKTGRTSLEHETFNVIRALLTLKPCTSVSLYASTGKGSGMLVRISATSFPSTFSAYTKLAAISFTE